MATRNHRNRSAKVAHQVASRTIVNAAFLEEIKNNQKAQPVRTFFRTVAQEVTPFVEIPVNSMIVEQVLVKGRNIPGAKEIREIAGELGARQFAMA